MKGSTESKDSLITAKAVCAPPDFCKSFNSIKGLS